MIHILDDDSNNDGNRVEDYDTRADDSMDHVHNNRQEIEEQAHIDVSF